MGVVQRIDASQRRRPALALPVAVAKRFSEHGGSRLAANISYYSFFSVFPLMLSFVTVLGLVLDDRPDIRDDLVNGAIGQIPVIGSQIADASLSGSVLQLVVGLALALWAGLGAVNALQFALDEIGDVPSVARTGFAGKRLRSLIELVVLALGVALSVVLANVTSLFDLGVAAGIAGLAGNVVVVGLVMLATYLVLPSARLPARQLLPGAVLAGTLVAVLQAASFYIVRRYISGASDTYGTFASIIAMLSYFFLVSRIVLYGAELNSVLARGTSPRSLAVQLDPTDADRRTVLDDIERIRRDPRVPVPTTAPGHTGPAASKR